MTLYIPQAIVVQGEPIAMALEVANNSLQTISYERPSTNILYDFWVTDEQGNLVWYWTHDKIFLPAESSDELHPQERRVAAEAWAQTECDAEERIGRLPPGRYRAQGLWEGSTEGTLLSGGWYSNVIEFQVIAGP